MQEKDELLKQALDEVLTEELEWVPCDNELKRMHTFSREFEKKIKKMIVGRSAIKQAAKAGQWAAGLLILCTAFSLLMAAGFWVAGGSGGFWQFNSKKDAALLPKEEDKESDGELSGEMGAVQENGFAESSGSLYAPEQQEVILETARSDNMGYSEVSAAAGKLYWTVEAVSYENGILTVVSTLYNQGEEEIEIGNLVRVEKVTDQEVIGVSFETGKEQEKEFNLKGNGKAEDEWNVDVGEPGEDGAIRLRFVRIYDGEEITVELKWKDSERGEGNEEAE